MKTAVPGPIEAPAADETAKPWFVYLICCSEGSLYTGITNRPLVRWINHQTGKGAKYTKSHQPLRWVLYGGPTSKRFAAQLERYVKGLPASRKLPFFRNFWGKMTFKLLPSV